MGTILARMAPTSGGAPWPTACDFCTDPHRPVAMMLPQNDRIHGKVYCMVLPILAALPVRVVGPPTPRGGCVVKAGAVRRGRQAADGGTVCGAVPASGGESMYPAHHGDRRTGAVTLDQRVAGSSPTGPAPVSKLLLGVAAFPCRLAYDVGMPGA